MVKKIIVIDDKPLASEQINKALSTISSTISIKDFEIFHYRSQKEYLQKEKDRAEILFLDFFLDHDRKTGSDILGSLNSEYLVGFSSKKSGSDHILKSALTLERWEKRHIYSLKKIKAHLTNPPLECFFRNLQQKEEIGLFEKRQKKQLESDNIRQRCEAISEIGACLSRHRYVPKWEYAEILSHHLLKDKSDQVRYTAAGALGTLGFFPCLKV